MHAPTATISTPTTNVAMTSVMSTVPSASSALYPAAVHMPAMDVAIALWKIRLTSCTCVAYRDMDTLMFLGQKLISSINQHSALL